jgi:hypothetical protein
MMTPEILSVFPTKPDTVVLTTAKGELMSFNVTNRQVEDLDEFDDPTMKQQFEEIMNEGRSVDSMEHINFEQKCNYVLMDSNQNYILVRGESLLIYKPTCECEILIEKMPPSKMILYKSMILIHLELQQKELRCITKKEIWKDKSL